MRRQQIPNVLFYTILGILLLGGSAIPPGNVLERARAFTRAIEFDYVEWTLEAWGLKFGQSALGVEGYLPAMQQSDVVLDYLELIRQIWQVEYQIGEIYADPAITDADHTSQALRAQLDDLRLRRSNLEPLAEEILQAQISYVASRLGLTLGGQPVPPVLYRTTPPPYALIISPRDIIRQDYDISIDPQITVAEIVVLESQVDQALNVSSLVVGIGGIGLYPTMVMETADINWLVEVVAHEWVHNFLTLRPLGINYLTDATLRAINETVASIAGKELGHAVIEQFYPEYLPPPPPPESQPAPAQEQETPPVPVFDYRAEMHETRLNADRLLADGQIETAEWYMELRRRFLWDNGYHIRKLNQAYFAFYGAYADQPGGPAGATEDPIGEAVRTLRANSRSLAEFLNRISWMWSFEQLLRATGN